MPTCDGKASPTDTRAWPQRPHCGCTWCVGFACSPARPVESASRVGFEAGQALMEVRVSRVKHRMPARWRASCRLEGRQVWLVRDARSDSYTRMHGLATVSARPVFVVRARCLRSSVARIGLLMLRSRMLWRGTRGLPPLQPTWCTVRRSVGVGERPAEPAEFARDGDCDDRAALAAVSVEPLPDVVQAALTLPGDLDDVAGCPAWRRRRACPLAGARR